MKMTENELKSIVICRVDELNACILCDKTDEYLNVRARLSEALTFAMQLNLLEPTKATEIGAKANAHICKVYGAAHIDDVKQMILKEYAEDIFEEFMQIDRFEGKINLKDVADILQIESGEE